jgi:hypothetical protein
MEGRSRKIESGDGKNIGALRDAQWNGASGRLRGLGDRDGVGWRCQRCQRRAEGEEGEGRGKEISRV